MSAIADARTAVRDALRGALAPTPVHDHLPQQVTPPCVVVVPADPYITAGETFDGEEVGLEFDVWAVAPAGDNEFISDAVDNLLEDVIAAAVGSDYGVGDITAPSGVTVNGSVFLAARVPVSTYVNIT